MLADFCSGDEGQQSLLVLVPDFSQTASCVLINLRTLECQLQSLSSDLMGKDDEGGQDRLDRSEDSEPMDEGDTNLATLMGVTHIGQ